MAYAQPVSIPLISGLGFIRKKGFTYTHKPVSIPLISGLGFILKVDKAEFAKSLNPFDFRAWFYPMLSSKGCIGKLSQSL